VLDRRFDVGGQTFDALVEPAPVASQSLDHVHLDNHLNTTTIASADMPGVSPFIGRLRTCRRSLPVDCSRLADWG
jgi:hypothetical protein